MNNASASMAPSIGTHEVDAAEHACTAQAKAENTRHLAAMSEDANEGHIAEHIRGLVAVTMAHLSVNASTTTVGNAEHWRGWALGVADCLERMPVVG